MFSFLPQRVLYFPCYVEVPLDSKLGQCGYSISKRLVKLTRFQCYPLQVSGYQDIAPLLYVLRYQLQYVGWVFICARSVENNISVERLNTLYTDLQSILQNINIYNIQ